MKNEYYIKLYTGMESYNNFGSKIIISRYKNARDIDIYFPEYDWTYEHAELNLFKSGQVACPYEKRIHGIGYIGEGEYKSRENGKLTKCYQTWKNMLERCYGKKRQEKYPSYKDCFVCDEWHCYQNFAKWYEDNYYEIPNDIMCLDKDILTKGNKVYSPNTCVFVPQRINLLFTKSDKTRGEYPIGVCYDKNEIKLKVTCSYFDKKTNKKKVKHLSYYQPNQVEEAFLCYKQFKEKLIKEVAKEYKHLIPSKLYHALINYEVKIDD